MKAIRITFLGFLVLFAAMTQLPAQKPFAPGAGLALKISTNGFGADAVYNFHQKMGIRLGFEKSGFKTDFHFQEESIEYVAKLDLNTGSVSLLFDYYLLDKIFLSAGAGWNLFRAAVDGEAAGAVQFGDVMIPKEKIGTFNFLIEPSLKLSPYAGVGFGRTLGLNKKVGFAFEMGGFFQGSPDITINSSGLLSPTSNPDQQQELKLEKQIKQYSIYPVLKFSLSYKIISF